MVWTPVDAPGHWKQQSVIGYESNTPLLSPAPDVSPMLVGGRDFGRGRVAGPEAAVILKEKASNPKASGALKDRQCTYCKGVGHTEPYCHSKMQDDAAKKAKGED